MVRSNKKGREDSSVAVAFVGWEHANVQRTQARREQRVVVK